MATPAGSNIDSTEDDNIKENNRKATTSSMVSPEIRLSMVNIICTKTIYTFGVLMSSMCYVNLIYCFLLEHLLLLPMFDFYILMYLLGANHKI